MKRHESGFTLIELMIVVAIIGILIAVGIPQYQNYVARAQATEGLSLLSGAKTAVAEYVMTNGSFPESNSDAGLSDATTISGQYVKSVGVTKDGDEGVITATFNTGINENIEDKIMMLTASNAGGSVTFECTTTIYESYAPKDCTSVPVIYTATDKVVITPVAPAVKQSGGFDYGTPWVSGAMGEATACWEGEIDQLTFNASGRWVVGENSVREEFQDGIRQFANIDRGRNLQTMHLCK
jgi:type IV pilus assembly protein PilA